ncbi:hypothetical protein OBBRIDRAFT_737957 [Obba rivulosa]|uniref:Uncharacterized protein n=1 Tax=Obba rivulosa TaxID=1052685 RepID=A0A8E2DI42_9APHY|nr:hypothetical protein OBBRIDRAFT_737957 [Obba rivulosa]
MQCLDAFVNCCLRIVLLQVIRPHRLSSQGLTMPRRPELDDLLADSIVVLETLKEASSAVSAVPFLGAVIGTCVNLLKTIENVKSLDDRGKRLARRAADLAQYIEQRISHDVEAIDADLGQNLATLTITLERVQQDIEEQRKRKFRNRLLRYNSISRKLDEHMDALDRARDSFNVRYLRIQYHLFRKPELRLRAVKGDWIIQNEKAGEEWTADWGGRTVVVRRLQSSRAQQVRFSSIVSTFHPHVAQILGYSHSDVPEKFYVMETGERIMRYPPSKC